MSKMRTVRKPPLAAKPHILRSSSTTSVQTPPGSLTKSKKPIDPIWEDENSGTLRPEYRSISCELRALSNMVKNELGNGDPLAGNCLNVVTPDDGPVFERGRLYDEYSARRNARLSSKMRCRGGNNKNNEEPKTPSYKASLGVTVGTSKRGKESSTRKSISALRKSADAAIYCASSVKETSRAEASAGSAGTARYMLRSMTKDSKKPLLPPVAPARTTRRSGRA